MVDRPDPRCLPLELEMLPLYRDPGRRRALRRRQRRHEAETRRARMRVRLAMLLGARAEG